MHSKSPHTRPLPGDWSPNLGAMLRVNHAGEYGAQRIYAGQLAVLGRSAIGPELRHMAAQEEEHLAAFNRLLPQHRVRPTALLPVWHVAGYALGLASALLGEKAAMAATVAVETVITEHYDAQLNDPALPDGEIRDKVAQFRAEEMEHHDTGLAHAAEEAPFYPLLNGLIQAGCRLAIRLSSRC